MPTKPNISFTNQWDGTIGDEWSKIELDDQMLEKAIKDYVIDYFLGSSVLEGNGQLKEYWDDIEEFLVFKGYIVLLQKPYDEGRIYFCDIYHEDYTLIGKEELILTNLDDISKEKVKVIENGKPIKGYKFVIFENNRMRKPSVKKYLDYFIKKIVNVVRKMEIDLFTSERRVMLILPQQPSEEDVDYQVSTFSNIFFTYIAFQHSRKPDAQQIKQGLTGIKPSQIGEPVFIEPKRDQRADYWRDYYYWMGELERFMGIRNDQTGQGNQNKERENTGETKNSSAPYIARERKAWKARWRGIQEWQSVFKEVGYKLRYGEYTGEERIN